jgi:hypothetical protein
VNAALQVTLFFCCLTVAGALLAAYAFSLGDTGYGVIGLVGVGCGVRVVARGVQMLRSGPPPDDG